MPSESAACPHCGGSLESGPLPKLTTKLPRDLLDSNKPATESQIPLIRDFLFRARTVARTEKNRLIAELQSALDKLCVERDELDVEIQKHEGALSPLRRMPPEVLSHIFALTFSQSVSRKERRVSAPWISSTVCARWRDIALSPFFWTTISTQDPHLRSVSALEAQLGRSEDLPLKIYFDGDSIANLDLPMVEVLTKHAARWEIVYLKGEEEMFSEIRRTSPQFPMLRELRLEMIIIINTPPPSIRDIFSCAPRLDEVSVVCWGSRSPSPLDLTLPWHQLSTFSASGKCGAFAFSNLASAANLIECNLNLYYYDGAILSTKVVLLPRLLRLSVSHHELLTHLETPALTELFCHNQSDLSKISNLTVFHRLRRTLRKLGLDATRSQPIFDLAGTVEMLPPVQSLAFIGPAVSVQSIRAFLFSLSKSAPTLEHIALVTDADFETFAPVIDDLEAMDWGTHYLRSLMFYGHNLSRSWRSWATPPVDTRTSRLELLRGRGVTVEISATDEDFYRRLVPGTAVDCFHCVAPDALRRDYN